MTDKDCTMPGTCHWGESKVALVTGSARRVGKAIVSALHKHGYNVVIHCNSSQAEANALCGQLNGARASSAHVISGDLSASVAATAQRLVAEAQAQWGRLDLLVNNASLFFLTPLENATERDWDRLMDTNVKAPFFLTQAAAPHLKATKGGVINLCDVIGEQASPPLTIYGISKAALIMATKNHAIELGPEPHLPRPPPPLLQEWLSRTPLGRIGTAEDVADAVVFLASPSSSYVTGSGITVCGGRSLRL
ncbi:pteridine reductase 1-like [Penaeus chinensis]|uniref:pteridine reductase 1-like n=1 Tax=Penaeus chinensis TaxID=139456 RepID=UPI001FB5826A|nr:pteridine reductase 1-like [Penaeus chinensis]